MRILIFLISLALASPAFGGNVVYLAEQGASSCPAFYADTNVVFSWDGDHSSGTNYGCNSSGDGIAGTNNGLTISPSYGESGSNGALLNALNAYLQWADTGDQYIDDVGPQTIFVRVYCLTSPSSGHHSIVEANAGDGDDVISIYVSNALLARGAYIANTDDQTEPGSTISTGVWMTLGYSWDFSSGNHAVYTSSSWGSGANELSTSMSANLSVFGIGEDATPLYAYNDGTFYITQYVLMDGYKASPPSNW